MIFQLQSAAKGFKQRMKIARYFQNLDLDYNETTIPTR